MFKIVVLCVFVTYFKHLRYYASIPPQFGRATYPNPK